MFLAIDNTKSGALIFFTSSDGKSWQRHDFEKSGKDDLVSAFDATLRQQALETSAIQGLAVKVGEGSFTSTRLATTFANTLAYALRIPVMALKDFDFDTLANTISETPVGRYAHAKYSGEPRLGKK